MKYLFSLLLIAITFGISASPDYPDEHRFVQYSVPDTAAYIIVDTKTGCEYISAASTAYTLVRGTCKIPEKK